MSDVVGPLSVTPIADRIRAALVPPGATYADATVRARFVGTASDLAAVEDTKNLLDLSIYVMQPIENSSVNSLEGSGAFGQMCSSIVPVLVCVQENARAGGEARPDRVGPLVRAVRAQLLNWRHPDADRVFRHVDGRVVRMTDDGLILWLERFRTEYSERILPS